MCVVGKPAPQSGLFQKLLYLSLGLVVISGPVCRPATGQVQEETPQVTTRAKKVKRDQQPRAIGLLQLSPSGKATLIPIAIMIDKTFYDASAYKATPVPMALESGTIYEVERTGESLGLFTVNAAQHSLNANATSPWIGTGVWLPEGTTAPKTTREAETAPVGIEEKDEPPRLTKGDNPPQRPPAAGSGSPSAAPQGPASSTGTSSTTKPTASREAPAPPPDNPSTKPAGSGDRAEQESQVKEEAGDPNVPRLRRAKPTPLPSDAAAPDYVQAGSAAAKGGAAGNATEAAAGKSVQLVPAISDAGGPQPRSYKFDWSSDEQEKAGMKLLDLAADEFRIYLRKMEQGKIAAQAPPKAATARKVEPRAQQPVFENVQLRAFDVWTNNEPVMVLSAEAHMPGKTGAAGTTGTYLVTLAARTDIYGNLRKLYSGVTDRFHLDVTPQLELIDAVDADGDGYGELLFRETADNGQGYVIYKPTSDVLWKVFDSLNPD